MRALVNDDPAQSATAREILSSHFALSASVLLEVEWVLRSTYKWPRREIAQSLSEIVDLPMLIAGPPGIAWAIERYASGADFADVIHLATAPPADRFVTFDRRLARRAGSNAPIAIQTLA